MKERLAERASRQGLMRSRVTEPSNFHKIIPRKRFSEVFFNLAEPIVVVAAPPGFGKSAAIASCINDAQSTYERRAWFSLHKEDDAQRVFQYIAFAFIEAGLNTFDLDELSPGAGRELHISLQDLLSKIENFCEQWILILENADLASNDVFDFVIRQLLRLSPANLKIVLSATNANSLDLSEFSGRGLVKYLTSNELRFDVSEIREIWSESISTSKAHEIFRQTCGWPILIRLMKDASVRPERRSSESRHAISKPIADFVSQRIIPTLSHGEVQVLTKLSLLPRFSSKIACALLEEIDVPEDMELLERSEFIVEIGSDERMARAVHPVFKQYFLTSASMNPTVELKRFPYEAARLYLINNKPLNAVRIAAKTEDDDFIGDIIEDCEPILIWLRDGAARLQKIMRLAPTQVVRQRPSVGYARVISLIKIGKLKDAQKLFDEIDQFHGRPTGAIDARVASERALCYAMLAMYKGSPIPKTERSVLEHWAGQSGELGRMLKATSVTLESYTKQIMGEFDAAKQIAKSAIAYSIDARSQYNAYFMYCDLAMMSGYQGDIEGTIKYFREGDRMCLQSVRDDERLAVIRDVFRIEFQHELEPRDTKSNERLRNICRRLPKLEGWPDVYAAAYRTYSEKLLLSNDTAAALSLLSTGLLYAEREAIRPLINVLKAQRIFVLSCAGMKAESKQQIEYFTRMLKKSSRHQLTWREQEAIAEAQIAAATINGVDIDSGRINDLLAEFRTNGNVRSEYRLRRLLCLVNSQPPGNANDKTTSRKLVAEQIWVSGFKRTSQFTKILSKGHRDTSSSVVDTRMESFTEREMSVLRLLNEGKTDKAIAKELGISAHGVRYHLKRIYAQFGVNNRRDACRRAIELSIWV